MNFSLSEEQLMLTETLKRYLQGASSVDNIRQYVGVYGSHKAIKLGLSVPEQSQFERAHTGFMRNCHEGLVELGIHGVMVPEAFGGLGMELLDAALIVEQLGYHAACVPFLASNILAPLALVSAGSEAQQAKYLPGIATGTLQLGVGLSEHASYARTGAKLTSDGDTLSGDALFVLDFAADAYLLADQQQNLWIVAADAAGLTRSVTESVDLTRTVGDLHLQAVAAEKLPGGGAEVLARLIDTGRVMLAADSLGAAQSMFDKTIVYTGEREQFGRPIGSFQALKHICAEMVAALEPCRAMMWYAAYALDHLQDQASSYAARSKAHISEVGLLVSRKSIETYGGMGFTDLVGLHYWFKRIGGARYYLGSPTHLRAEALAKA